MVRSRQNAGPQVIQILPRPWWLRLYSFIAFNRPTRREWARIIARATIAYVVVVTFFTPGSLTSGTHPSVQAAAPDHQLGLFDPCPRPEVCHSFRSSQPPIVEAALPRRQAGTNPTRQPPAAAGNHNGLGATKMPAPAPSLTPVPANPSKPPAPTNVSPPPPPASSTPPPGPETTPDPSPSPNPTPTGTADSAPDTGSTSPPPSPLPTAEATTTSE